MKWDYWKWLFKGLNGKAGLRKFLDVWIIFHALIAYALSEIITMPLHDVSRTLMLPIASIFIGLSFAWAGNAQALLQTEELKKLFENHTDGLKNYIYTFQTSILIILVLLVGWGLAGLQVFQGVYVPYLPRLPELVLYFISSLAFRECWHVVLGSQILILQRLNIQNILADENNLDNSKDKE